MSHSEVLKNRTSVYIFEKIITSTMLFSITFKNRACKTIEFRISYLILIYLINTHSCTLLFYCGHALPSCHLISTTSFPIFEAFSNFMPYEHPHTHTSIYLKHNSPSYTRVIIKIYDHHKIKNMLCLYCEFA